MTQTKEGLYAFRGSKSKCHLCYIGFHGENEELKQCVASGHICHHQVKSLAYHIGSSGNIQGLEILRHYGVELDECIYGAAKHGIEKVFAWSEVNFERFPIIISDPRVLENAVIGGNVRIVETLLNMHQNPTETCLEHAIKHKHTDIVRILLKHGNFDDCLNRCILLSVQLGCIEIFQVFAGRIARIPSECTATALKTKNSDMLRQILAFDGTPVEYSNGELDLNILKVLVDLGKVDINKQKLLHRACAEGKADVVEFLCSTGLAKLGLRDNRVPLTFIEFVCYLPNSTSNCHCC